MQFVAIIVEKSQERAHFANAGKFNRLYLTCQMLAILYADRRKSQSLQLAHLAIFVDRSDRRIKSPSVPAVAIAIFADRRIKIVDKIVDFNFDICSVLKKLEATQCFTTVIEKAQNVSLFPKIGLEL